MANTSARMLRLLSYDGTCRLRMSVGSLDWPAMVLGSVGTPFDIVKPPELTEHLRTIVAVFTQSVEAKSPR